MNKSTGLRYKASLEFLKKHISFDDVITELGERNNLTELLLSEGYRIVNTSGDLDYGFDCKTDAIIAFQIFEHMFAPFNILDKNRGKLVCSVPLRLWFSKEYWNYNDKRDCHYHEFSVRQFNHLLERTGWKIVDKKICNFSTFKIGIRPFLRLLYPRYYFVYAEKN
jgi:hypothetical protein